jgi:hypothetical protein
MVLAARMTQLAHMAILATLAHMAILPSMPSMSCMPSMPCMWRKNDERPHRDWGKHQARSGSDKEAAIKKRSRSIRESLTKLKPN